MNGRVKTWDSKLIKTKLPVVCRNCNNTWMSSLAEQIKKYFLYAIRDHAPQSILPEGQRLLYAYTFLKAVVVDYDNPYDEVFFTRASRERFRRSLAIPDGTQVWLGAFRGESRYSGRCTISYLEVPSGPLIGIQWFAFTYVVGGILLQLLAPRWKHILQRGHPLPINSPNRSWNKAAIRIWPPSEARVTWPPLYIGEDSIHRFSYRFSEHTQMELPRS
jgi:hypothetical protein